MMNTKIRLGFLIVLVMAMLTLAACTSAEEATEAPADSEEGGGEEEGAVEEEEIPEPPGTGENVLNIYNWSTYMDPNILTSFEEEFGVTINYDLFGDNDELLAKIQPGNPGYDIIVPTDYMVEIMKSLDLLEPLDHNLIPNLSNVDPVFADPPYDPGMAHCVPYQWGTTGLGYNITATGREIDSWEVMFSGEFAGRIAWLTDARGVLGVTLRYLGYDPNTANEAEIDEAVQLLLDTKDDVVAFAADNGQDLLSAGEVDITYEYNGDIVQLMTENPDIRFVYPKEGSVLWTDNMCIPAGAPHPELAHQFINYILDAQVGADLSNFITYGTPNAASLPLIDPEYRENPAVYPSDEVMQTLFFIVSLGEADLLYEEAWTRLGIGQ